MEWIKIALGWPVAWLLFWIGHGLSRIWELDLEWAWRPYQWCMRQSCAVDDWMGGGFVWVAPPEDE